MTRLTSIAVCLSLLTAGAAVAQDDPAAGKSAKPSFDAVAKKAWDAWRKLEYSSAKDGLKRATLKLKATIESPRLPEPMTATGDYSFDSAKTPKGKLSWADQRVGMVLARQGWGQKRFDGMFQDDSEQEFAGCKLTGVVKDKKTIVTISGHKSNVTGFTFNEKGVLESAEITPPNGAGKIVFKMSHTEIDGKYHSTGWSYTVNVQGSQVSSTVKLTSAKVDKYYVLKSMTETIQRDGQTMATVKIETSDQTVNAAATPTSKPAKED